MRQPGPSLRLLFWETTAACNLECAHCRRLDVSRELSREDLNTEEGLAFVRSLRELGTPILVLSGGEPLRPSLYKGNLRIENKNLGASAHFLAMTAYSR